MSETTGADGYGRGEARDEMRLHPERRPNRAYPLVQQNQVAMHPLVLAGLLPVDQTRREAESAVDRFFRLQRSISLTDPT